MKYNFHWLEDQSCFPCDGAMISFERIPRDPWDRVAWIVDLVPDGNPLPSRTIIGVSLNSRTAIRESQKAFRHLADPKKRFRVVK